MTAALILTAGAGILLTVMGAWAYTGHWSTWFTRSKARGRITYTGPAALFAGIALIMTAAVMAGVLTGAPKPVSYALIVPVAVAAALAAVSNTYRPPSFLIPAWTQTVPATRTKENHE